MHSRWERYRDADSTPRGNHQSNLSLQRQNLQGEYKGEPLNTNYLTNHNDRISMALKVQMTAPISKNRESVFKRKSIFEATKSLLPLSLLEKDDPFQYFLIKWATNFLPVFRERV